MAAKRSGLPGYAAVLVAVLLSACAAAPQTVENTPERAVEDAFVAYKAAILAQDGTSGSALVTAASQDYYRDMADEALTADRQRLLATHIVDRITILLLRQNLTVDQLRRMTGRELTEFAIDRGWVSKDSAARTKLSNYRIFGDVATANVVNRSGELSKISMRFRFEQEAWRLDLLKNLEEARKIMKLALALSGKTEDELLSETLEKGSSGKSGPEIWDPPL